VQLDQALDERQAETGPRLPHATLELFENAGLIGERDPDTGIGDRQQ
jgi:hypothetical protein